MCDNDIYALFISDEQEEAKDSAKQAGLNGSKVPSTVEVIDKPAQDLLLNDANPLRVAWWF